MKPCYIDAYAVKGACAINVNGVDFVEDRPEKQCMVNFKDGSQLLLDEACEGYHQRAPLCAPTPTPGVPVYG